MICLNSSIEPRRSGASLVRVVIQAVVEVVVDQAALGLRHRAFHRMQLLGDVEARSPRLDHRDDAAQMPLGALQPLDDGGMGGVRGQWHAFMLSPWRG